VLGTRGYCKVQVSYNWLQYTLSWLNLSRATYLWYLYVQPATIQPEMQSTEHETNLANGVQNNAGWRVGRNPPSVLSDIHLIGIPAPLAEVTGAYYSFHGVGWHFTLTVRLLNASASLSMADRGSFCALTRSLDRHFTVSRFRPVDGVSSGHLDPESLTNSPTQPI